MLHAELLGGASLEALALLLASSYALAEHVKLWLPGCAVDAALARSEDAPASVGSRRRAEALRPRGRSHCLSRVETPRVVRIRGQ
jgi:hypothetical protein